MLNVINISKSFNQNPILRSVSFHAKSGELAILQGKNGAGKSTLFAIIAGLLPTDGGEIWLDDIGLINLSLVQRANYIALLKQDPKISTVASMGIMENMTLASLKNRRASLFSATRPHIHYQIINHMNMLELSHVIDLTCPVGDLSGGQRQLIAFAMATLNRPHLLLLDEPTAALDEASSHHLMKLIKRLIAWWKIPAVLISHDRELNQTYGDAILYLENGTIA